jgi:hypothetical protein
VDRSFAARLQDRQEAWWGNDLPLAKRLHRLRELTRRHRPEDREEAWRCCHLWQRTLTNKLNGRAFAERHGVPVPETYWQGRRPQTIPWDRIPDQFVVKPVWGRSKIGVYAISQDRDQVRNLPMTRADVIAELARGPRLAWVPWTLEEHVKRPDGTYGEPLEYKFHVFRDRVEAVSLLSRHEQRLGFYTPDWELFPETLSTWLGQSEMPRPDCLDEMLEAATRLGSAYGTYVRVDIFWTEGGFKFNEFSTAHNRGFKIRPGMSDYFGDCWRRMLERFPDEPEP